MVHSIIGRSTTSLALSKYILFGFLQLTVDKVAKGLDWFHPDLMRILLKDFHYIRALSAHKSLPKRNSRRGFAGIISTAIILSSVVLIGTVLLTSSNLTFLIQVDAGSKMFTDSANAIKEDFSVEDVHFNSVTTTSSSTGDGRIVYGFSGNTIAKTRQWTNSSNSWGSQSDGPTQNSNIEFVITKPSPVNSKYLSLSATTTGTAIYVQHFDGTNWVQDWSANVNYFSGKSFDIAFEQTSGQALVVYRNASDITYPYYYVWDSTNNSWVTNYTKVPTTVPAEVKWIKLASKPASNQIALAWSDINYDLHAMIWNGDTNSWGSELTPTQSVVNLNTKQVLKFDLAYENGGNNELLLVVSSDTLATTLRYLVFNGSWSTVTSVSVTGMTISQKIAQIGLAPDFNSDYIYTAFCTELNQLWAATWTGSSIGNFVRVDQFASCDDWNAVTPGNNFAISAVGDSNSNKALIVYNDPQGGGKAVLRAKVHSQQSLFIT